MRIVLKIGGTVLRENLSAISRDIKENFATDQVVLVHGGGVEVTEIAEKMGKTQDFVVSPKGFRSRYTDEETAAIYTMVMAGKVNKQIVANFQTHGLNGVGLSGIDGRIIQAKRKTRIIIKDDRGKKRVIDGGYTGKISIVDSRLLWLLLDSGYFPIIAPVAIGEEYEPLNIDGDRTAAYVAGALKAEKIIFLTDTPGVYLNDKLRSKITIPELKTELKEIGPGMITKAFAAIEALSQGVHEAIIASGRKIDPISLALTHECGTVIKNE